MGNVHGLSLWQMNYYSYITGCLLYINVDLPAALQPTTKQVRTSVTQAFYIRYPLFQLAHHFHP